MKYIQKECDLYIDLGVKTYGQIIKQTEACYPNETGGMLIGRYSPDKKIAYVEATLSPLKTVSERKAYYRDPSGLESEWAVLKKRGLQYIGEWHSHPNGSSNYSSLDYEAMKQISSEISVKNPLLLIVGIRNEGACSHTFYCYKNDDLLIYDTMIDLKDLFHGLQDDMMRNLQINREFITHPGSKGDATEQRWISFLRDYLPSRYKVDKAMVIDSNGNVSEQIDIVIYDSLHTPFIFNKDNFLYIPAEAVYAVFEVKQNISGQIEYAAKKIESVRKLKRTSIEMINAGISYPAKRLTKIIGGILSTTSTDSINAIEKKIKKLTGLQTLDMACICDTGSITIKYNENESKTAVPKEQEDKQKEIDDQYRSRREPILYFSDKEVSLFSFFLQLVSNLNSIGTVPAIDINAYLKAINTTII